METVTAQDEDYTYKWEPYELSRSGGIVKITQNGIECGHFYASRADVNDDRYFWDMVAEWRSENEDYYYG